jgi:putative DNA primase/helicase
MVKVSNNIKKSKQKSGSMILSKLLKDINKIDFKSIVYSSFKENKIPVPSDFKLKRYHYIVISVEKLIKTAKSNNWGLCKKNGLIYLYNGNYWNEIDKEEFQYFLGEAALKMGVEKYSGIIHTFKEELFKQFMSVAFLSTPDKELDNIFINLQNGTFEINKKKQFLRDFKRKDFITYQLPFEFQSNASCPMFQVFLDEVIPDKGKQMVLAEYLGYLFCRSSVLKLEKMLILYGTGANGKSVVFDIVNALLGRVNVSNYTLQSLTNSNGYYRAKIANKLVNYASEINGKLETDIFKQMASGEPIEARLPYGEPFILNDYAKLIFNCNELPRDVEHTNAFFRRFLIIDFNVTIPDKKQDVELSKKIIKDELSGVFNWVLEGLNRLLEQKKFSKCKSIESARVNYEKQSDSVKMFIDEFGYIKSSKEYILIKTLYDHYRTYCIEDGFKSVNKSNFIKRLNHHKIYVKRISKGNAAPLALKNNVITDEDELPF